MALRCGCENEADDIVFGALHRCEVNPKPPADLPRLVPSSWFVVPETSEGVAADNLQQELDRLERPYERVLGEDELHD